MTFKFGLVIAVVSSCLLGCAQSMGNPQSLTTNTYSCQRQAEMEPQVKTSTLSTIKW
jgi:hypothetical protein